MSRVNMRLESGKLAKFLDSPSSGGSNCLAYSRNHKRDLMNMGTWKQAFRPMIMISFTVACASS